MHIKKAAKYLPLFVLAFFIASAAYYGFSRKDKGISQGDPHRFKVPGRLVDAGPYGTNVISSEKIGECRFDLKAEKLYVKKTRILGFDNALFKKLVARELDITIFRADRKLLALHKSYQEMPLDMRCVKIDRPDILFPESFRQPDRVKIDKERRLITFYYGNRTDEWDLTQISP